MSLVIKARDNSGDIPDVPLTPDEKDVAATVNQAASGLEVAAVSAGVQSAIGTGNIEAVINALPWDETASILNQTATAFNRVSRKNIGVGFPKVGFQGVFDYTDPRTLAYAQQQSAKLVTNMTEQMIANVRTVIGRAFEERIPVYDAAIELRSVINLTIRQEVTLSKFSDLNRARLISEGYSGRKLELKLNSLVERQYKKMIAQRSKVIARNEILVAEGQGRFLGFEQMVEQGWAHPMSVKRWSTSTDERTCTICAPMNGMSVQWNQSYPNGVFNPPAHIQCRCSISLLEPDSRLAQNFMPTGVVN